MQVRALFGNCQKPLCGHAGVILEPDIHCCEVDTARDGEEDIIRGIKQTNFFLDL